MRVLFRSGRVNDDTIRTWDDVVRQIVSGPAELTFQVAGRFRSLMIDLGQGGLAARQAVADALVPEVPVVVQRLEEGRPALRAGLKPGDVVVAVDGAPVRSVERFLERIWISGSRPLAFQALRGGAPLSIPIAPDTASGVDPPYPKRPRTYGFIGAQVQPGVTRVRKPPGEAIASGWQETTRDRKSGVEGKRGG